MIYIYFLELRYYTFQNNIILTNITYNFILKNFINFILCPI